MKKQLTVQAFLLTYVLDMYRIKAHNINYTGDVDFPLTEVDSLN